MTTATMMDFYNLAISWKHSKTFLSTKEDEQYFLKLCKEVDPYITSNDPAHRWEHLIDLMNNTIDIFNRFEVPPLQLGAEPFTFVLAILYHDIYTGRDRKNHHELAARHVRLVHTRFPSKWYTEICADELSSMVLYHRASTVVPEYEYASAHWFSAIDRGPMDFKNVVMRSVKYQQHHHPDGDHIALAIKHITEKFDREGYAIKNMSPYWKKAYGDTLIKLWEELESPDVVEKVKEYYL